MRIIQLIRAAMAERRLAMRLSARAVCFGREHLGGLLCLLGDVLGLTPGLVPRASRERQCDCLIV
jgi:hypothetical protein